MRQLGEVVLAIAIAPLFLGWIAQCRAWMQNRSAPPLLQPYRMLRKLFHKDGALHFHALLSNFNGRLKDSGKKQSGRTVYNMTGYRAGFTTAVPIDHNKGAVSNYIKKYITKDMPLIHGRKRYWISQNLIRPTKTVNAFSTIKTLPLFVKKTYEAEYYDVYEHMKV